MEVYLIIIICLLSLLLLLLWWRLRKRISFLIQENEELEENSLLLLEGGRMQYKTIEEKESKIEKLNLEIQQLTEENKENAEELILEIEELKKENEGKIDTLNLEIQQLKEQKEKELEALNLEIQKRDEEREELEKQKINDVENVFFSKKNNVREKIIQQLKLAEESVKVAVAWFTNHDLYDTLWGLAENGRKVELIIINDGINNKIDGLDLDKLAKHENVDFYFGDPILLMHHKFCIIDDKVLLNGSYNWTYYAEYINYENYSIINNNQEIVKKFIEEFETIKTKKETAVTPFNIYDKIEVDYFSVRNYLSNDLLIQADKLKSSNISKALSLLHNSIKLNPANKKAVSLFDELKLAKDNFDEKQQKTYNDIKNLVTKSTISTTQKVESESGNQQESLYSSIPQNTFTETSPISTDVNKVSELVTPTANPVSTFSTDSQEYFTKTGITKVNIPLGPTRTEGKLGNVEKESFPKLKIVLLIDISGSMKGLYEDNTVQNVVERVLTVASHLANDGDLNVWIFSTSSYEIGDINKDSFFNFVDNEILEKYKNSGIYQSTYAYTAMNQILNKDFQSTLNTNIICITDGEFDDRKKVQGLVDSSVSQSLFFEFVGLGKYDFSFLKGIVNSQIYSDIQNTNFFKLTDLSDKEMDEILNKRLLEDYQEWFQKAKEKGIAKY